MPQNTPHASIGQTARIIYTVLAVLAALPLIVVGALIAPIVAAAVRA